MKKYLLIFLSFISININAQNLEDSIPSPTEGVITAEFIEEEEMKADLLQMLADFTQYMVNDFLECETPNSLNEECGCFKGENTMGSNEKGVRPNADLSMVCAFLVKHGKPAGVTLPEGITWNKIEDMARKSLVYAYSTHKANKFKACTEDSYWGSVSAEDYVWESSLWAMSVAYSSYFQWEKLSDEQKSHIYAILKAECNYELHREIPTRYERNTKAEENGWETNVLAVALGMLPDDELAPEWFQRLREFAINSYSHPSDSTDNTVIDPWYDNATVADLYVGQNLYEDYSLQNHKLFHTSYQNVVMQELGESALTLKMFQQELHGTEKWKTNALMHNNQQVQENILNWLALADGELAMPNSNDWSLFLYDQITSYSTRACFQRDSDALMLENLAYKYIKARQKTTEDGSWLLRPDVGARRMGVQAHRVMMTYLMHHYFPTKDLTPTQWETFNARYSKARLIPCQNIVRAATEDRFTCFSWSEGKKSYTGYFAANNPDKNKIHIPYKAHNTGNILGWYELEEKATNARPVVSGTYRLDGNAYVMNGELNVNDSTFNHRFALYSTPSNAIIYLDHVSAISDAVIKNEKGGLLAISTDEFTKNSRVLYYGDNQEICSFVSDGTELRDFGSEWVNIDNQLGVISNGNGKRMSFGDREARKSIFTSKLYPMYDNSPREIKAGETVDARNLVYYSRINAEQTREMAEKLVSLKEILPEGWNGVIAPDNDCPYFIVSNFKGNTHIELSGLSYDGWAPVFRQPTIISENTSSIKFAAAQNTSIVQPLTIMVKGNNVLAEQIDDDSIKLSTTTRTKVSIIFKSADKEPYYKKMTLRKGKTVTVLRQTRQRPYRTYPRP